MDRINDLVAMANTLADIAENTVKQFFRSEFSMTLKESLSPLVTQADLAIEAQVREYLAKEVPEHAILGEEYGKGGAESEYLWVIDPIDGSSAFSCGKPTFTTLIALLERGKPIIGVINQPILKERWCGVAGRKTVFNNHVCDTGEVSKSGVIRISCTTPFMFDAGGWKKFEKLKRTCTVSSFGGDGYSYGLLASGFVDVVMEADLQIYDISSAIPIINGAGGCITDWLGNDITLDTFKGTAIATRNRSLHEKVLAIIN